MSLCTRMITGKHTGGPVPCGQCRLCRQNRRDKKTARLVLESQAHETALFVTLTYKDKFLPLQFTHPKTKRYYGHANGTLSSVEIVNFCKRLRRQYPPETIRLVYAGEYGDDERPHYHLIIWGLPWCPKSKSKTRNAIFRAWSDPKTRELKCNPERLDIQPAKSEQDVARYICSYIMKGLTNESEYRQNGFTGETNSQKLAGRYPEFSRGSLGLGASAIPALVQSLDTASGRNSIQLNGDIPRNFFLNGRQMPLDRYMRGKILDALKISDEIKEAHFSKYEEDMRALYVRARSNPSIPSTWTLDPYDLALPRERAWALEMQMQHEQAQSALVSLQRASLTKGYKNA